MNLAHDQRVGRVSLNPDRSSGGHDALREPLLGAAAAVVLAGIDTVFAARRRISSVYLADAAVEVAIAAGFGLTRLRAATGASPRT